MSAALALVAGAVAGCLGALLGLGGGVFLVPFLDLVVGLPFWTAASVSLITVIATSTVVTLDSAGRAPVNVRLGIVLQIFTALGATAGAFMLAWVTERAAERVFGGAAALIALVMFSRLDRRNVIADPDVDVGALGGRFHDAETGRAAAYRLKRPAVALAVAAAAGVVSTLAGLGGGIVIVPALNAWCGVPIRAAAATSAFMIGVTAIPGVIGHYREGHFGSAELAAAAVLGVLAGSQAGLWLGPRVRVRSLKLLLAGLLAAAAAYYLFFKG